MKNQRKENDKDFSELNSKIIELSKNIPENFFALGGILKIVKENQSFQDAGYSDFSHYLRKSEAISIDRTTVYDLIAIYNYFGEVLEGPWGNQLIGEIGWSKMRLIVRFIRYFFKEVKYDPNKMILINWTNLLYLAFHNSKRDVKEKFHQLKENPEANPIENYVLYGDYYFIKKKLKNGFKPSCPICKEKGSLTFETSKNRMIIETLWFKCFDCDVNFPMTQLEKSEGYPNLERFFNV